jgi:REP element-mobilizing transposase RayT
MPRRRVAFVPGEYYHVYNRGVERRPIFFERENYLFFLRKVREYLLGEGHARVSVPDARSVRDALPGTAPRSDAPRSDPDASSVRLAETVQTFPDAWSVRDSGGGSGGERPVSIPVYCLMPNHFHLLVYLRCADFSERMSSLQQSYTQAINRARSRVGPLFQGRFKAEHVDREEYLTHLSRYIHLNPVVPGLAGSPAEWEFSSYREYVGLRDGSLTEPGVILREFASREAYRSFVERGTSVLTSELRRILMDM